MIQFAVSKVLNVRSTTFLHTYIHKETWYSADGRTANQIDHILFIHQQLHFLLNLEKFNFTLEYT